MICVRCLLLPPFERDLTKAQPQDDPRWATTERCWPSLRSEGHELTAAVEFCGMLTQKVVDQEFDDTFEPTVEALLSSAHGETKVHPVSGFKDL